MPPSTTIAAGIASWSLDGPVATPLASHGSLAASRAATRRDVTSPADLNVILPASGRGPLARRCIRLLGIGVDGQALAAATQHHRDVLRGGAEGHDGLLDAWLAARILPTPQGNVRRLGDAPLWAHTPVQQPASGRSDAPASQAGASRIVRWGD